MSNWSILLIGFAVVGHILSMDGSIVAITSILTMGLMIPVWYVLANLWWLMLFIGGMGIAISVGRPLSGLALMIGLAGAFMWELMREIERGRFVPLMAAEDGVGQLPVSLEIVHREEGEADVDCDAFCRGVLAGGGVLWLTRAGEPLIYSRAAAEACRALDPAFDNKTPCLLARRSDGKVADLALVQKAVKRESAVEYEMKGNKHVVLWDRRADPLPIYTQEQLWNEALRMLGPGGGPGPKPRRVPHQITEGWLNLEGVVRRAGLPLYEHELEIDATLMLSVLQAMGSDPLTPGQLAMVREWLRNARYSWRDAPPTGIDREILLQLPPLPELVGEPWSHLGRDTAP